MTHSLYICCVNPTEILEPVALELVKQGLSLQAMSIEGLDVKLTVAGAGDAVLRLLDGLQVLESVTQVENLSAEEEEWFITSQICEVYC